MRSQMSLTQLLPPIPNFPLAPNEISFVQPIFQLVFVRSGNVLPWIGPALRGIVARELKKQVCVHPIAEQDTSWRYCRPCPHVDLCHYSRLFEPAPPGISQFASGADAAPTGLVLAPSFPSPERLRTGDRVIVSGCIAGRFSDPRRIVGQLLDALEFAGRGIGIGPERLKFDVELISPAMKLISSGSVITPETFPANISSTPTAAFRELRVELLSPLFLKAGRDSSSRQAGPSLEELLSASMRIVSRSFGAAGIQCNADFRQLKSTARQSPALDLQFETFKQRRWSNRTEQRYELQGVVGCGTYLNVAPELIPWLYWGGRLHVGAHRVSGAGAWQLTLR